MKIPIAQPMIGKEEIEAVKKVFKSGSLAQGPQVEKFEKEFAKFIGTKYAIAISSGTTALHLALLAAGIKAGDEVITTPFTFIATANSILYTGAKPVFADINEETYNLDPKSVESKIAKKTRVILVVHLYGQMADMEAISKIAKKHKLKIIEDACQSHGAKFKNKKAGSIGLASCFSFYPTKNMTTGEGGMITTNSANLALKAKILRNHGSEMRYVYDFLGYNFRMTDIAAAIGIEQLKKLNQFNHKRIENAKYLSRKLEGIGGIIIPEIAKGSSHVFHQYTIRVTQEYLLTRDQLTKKLQKKGIGFGIYYPILTYQQNFYKKMGYKDKHKTAEKLVKEVLSLPIHPKVNKSDLDYIAQVIRDVK